MRHRRLPAAIALDCNATEAVLWSEDNHVINEMKEAALAVKVKRVTGGFQATRCTTCACVEHSYSSLFLPLFSPVSVFDMPLD